MMGGRAYGTNRADHNAHPTTDTPLLITDDSTGFSVTVHSTGHTRLQTGSVITMAALDGKGKVTGLLNLHPWNNTVTLGAKGLDDVPGAGMLHQTVNLT